MIRVARATVGSEEILAMEPALMRGYYGHAEKVVEFEAALAGFLDVEPWQVVCVSSGTAALHLGLECLGVGPGDEVVLPSLTFCASFQAVGSVGAQPVACDVTPGQPLLDPDDLARRITPSTRAIMPMHYGGDASHLPCILDMARERGLRVVEDAAHAFGSQVDGQLVGSFGDVTCFSFDSIKTITCGEGGALVAQDPSVARECRTKRLLGMTRESPAHLGGLDRDMSYDVVSQGWRYHMSNLNAYIGLVQLEKAPRFIARRRDICRAYSEALGALPGVSILHTDYDSVAPFLYTMLVGEGRRKALRDHLRGLGIESSAAYPPNHLLTFYRTPESLPHTEDVYARLINLPLHCSLSDADVERVTSAVVDFFG